MLKVIKTFTSLNGSHYKAGQEITPYEYIQLFDDEMDFIDDDLDPDYYEDYLL